MIFSFFSCRGLGLTFSTSSKSVLLIKRCTFFKLPPLEKHQIARKGSKLGSPGTPLIPAASTAQTVTALVVLRGFFLCQEFKPSSDTQMKSCPLTSSISDLCLPQAESQWSMEHSTLAFPTPGLHDTQGRKTGSNQLLQRGARVDFSQGMLSSGGPCEPAELSTCITRVKHVESLTWPSSRNGLPSLHLCFVLFFF